MPTFWFMPSTLYRNRCSASTESADSNAEPKPRVRLLMNSFTNVPSVLNT
jgi:hypothetical protein